VVSGLDKALVVVMAVMAVMAAVVVMLCRPRARSMMNRWRSEASSASDENQQEDN
jgi:hypothetical protein